MRKGFALAGMFAAMLATAPMPAMASKDKMFSGTSKPIKLIKSSLASHPYRSKSHAPNIQEKNRHTNRLHSRKQAKMRAKRKKR